MTNRVIHCYQIGIQVVFLACNIRDFVWNFFDSKAVIILQRLIGAGGITTVEEETIACGGIKVDRIESGESGPVNAQFRIQLLIYFRKKEFRLFS